MPFCVLAAVKPESPGLVPVTPTTLPPSSVIRPVASAKASGPPPPFVARMQSNSDMVAVLVQATPPPEVAALFEATVSHTRVRLVDDATAKIPPPSVVALLPLNVQFVADAAAPETYRAPPKLLSLPVSVQAERVRAPVAATAPPPVLPVLPLSVEFASNTDEAVGAMKTAPPCVAEFEERTQEFRVAVPATNNPPPLPVTPPPEQELDLNVHPLALSWLETLTYMAPPFSWLRLVLKVLELMVSAPPLSMAPPFMLA